MLERNSKFFGNVQLRHFDCEHVIASYFDAAAFWGNIEHVMALTLPELLLYLQYASRIREAVKQN